MPKVAATVTTEVELTAELAAEWFCELDDEQQADFFIAVAEKAKGWRLNQHSQWWLVGKHLQTCECSTHEARELVLNLHAGLVAAGAT